MALGFAWCAVAGSGTAQPGTRVYLDSIVLPTYVEGAPDPNPPFDYFRPARFNYPYTLRTNLTNHRVSRVWRAVILENAYLRCTILPDLGGHLYSCRDLTSGAELFYANPSIKLTRIGYRGAWAALGIEFNFPVSHNWMTTSPVDFAFTRGEDGSASVWIGNTDRAYGMHWRVELRLHPGRAVLEQHTTLANRSDTRHRFYWWTNAAVRVEDDSRLVYPMRFTASHGFRDIDTWPVDARGTDNSVVGNHRFGPVSRFAHGSREPFMAVYHPRTRTGVVEYASMADLPARKVWSWGGDANGRAWRHALSDDSSAYVEIQRGLFRNQETYGFLEPGQTIRFTEYWIGVHDLDGITRATPDIVAHLRRTEGGSTLLISLNPTASFPGATLTARRSTDTLATVTRALHPQEAAQFRIPVSGAAPVTVLIRDRDGRLLFTHTEEAFDTGSPATIVVGPIAEEQIPPEVEWSDGDYQIEGDRLERNGDRLEAMALYERALERYPRSVPLQRAAGRLAVDLKQYERSATLLGRVLKRISNDGESWYYLGLARESMGDERGARNAWERAQAGGGFRDPARYALAGWYARRGQPDSALVLLDRLTHEAPDNVRAGRMGVALARTLSRSDARARLGHWRQLDPTDNLLRLEAVRLGEADSGLPAHLAGDPERIVGIAAAYLRFGLVDDAVAVLSGPWPTRGVHAEPGMPRPEAYPLIAYYRGYARERGGRSGAADYRLGSQLPVTYVFPNRRQTEPVLRTALNTNPDDATAHLLLGSLFLSGGRADAALGEWARAEQLNPRLPTLHRNIGYTMLYAGQDPEQAAAAFRRGLAVDTANGALYEGLDDALGRAGRSAGERADILMSYPDPARMPAGLLYRTARRLAESGRFDAAEALFRDRFFPSQEGGLGVLEPTRLGEPPGGPVQ